MNRWETLYMYVLLALFFILYHIQVHTHTIHIKIIKPFSINMEQHVCNVILVLFFLPFFATDLLLCKKKYASYCWCTSHNNIEDKWKHNRMSCLRLLHKLTNRECKKKIFYCKHSHIVFATIIHIIAVILGFYVRTYSKCNRPRVNNYPVRC